MPAIGLSGLVCPARLRCFLGLAEIARHGWAGGLVYLVGGRRRIYLSGALSSVFTAAGQLWRVKMTTQIIR
jgi:hypothetical protein